MTLNEYLEVRLDEEHALKSADAIKAYRKLLMKYHPDKPSGSTEITRKIIAASKHSEGKIFDLEKELNKKDKPESAKERSIRLQKEKGFGAMDNEKVHFAKSKSKAERWAMRDRMADRKKKWI